MLTRGRWWLLFLTTLFIVVVWPPDKDRSLAMTLVNWAVDPADHLPILPPQLGFGVGDDVQAVEAHDAQVRHYDELFNRDAWTRARLELKVADDPFSSTTERQLLLVAGVVVAFLTLRRNWG